MRDRPEYDLCIIGGGAAGLVTAAGAASLGAKVILIEKAKLGGDCLYYGCVPSKTLIHSATVANTIRHANRFGLDAHHEAIDQNRVMHRVAEVIKHIEPNDSPERFRTLGVEVVFDSASFSSPNSVQLSERTITARNFVLATGSRPAIPNISGIESVPYFTNETIFDNKENISHLIVLGGGPIGCEMAQSFVRLGVKVTLVSRNRLLPKEDADMAEVVKQQFLVDGIDLHLYVDTKKAEKTEQGISLELYGEQNHPQTTHLEGSHLLVATGRRSNIENLALEKAGINISDASKVNVDSRLRTSNKHIYACGDIAGPYLFTHMAEHQAGVVLQNTLFHLPIKVQTKAIPWCTFTSPELARVGLSEDDAEKQGIKYQVYCFPFSEVDRAIADGDTAGMAKIITNPRGKLLGACIVGPHAGELIAEYSLAITQGMKVSALSKTIHIYPTLAQINRRVADQRMKALLTPARKRWLKRLFSLRG